MIRIFLIAISLVATIPQLCVHAQTTTTWKGTLLAGGQQLRLEFDITRHAEKLTGNLRSLDQNNATVEMAEIKITDTELSFTVPNAGASFSGKLDEKQQTADGTFKQSGAEFPLKLNKVENKDPDAAKETLKEAWIGKLEMGLVQPVMQFRIMNTHDGNTALYFDSVTEGRFGFNGTWSIEDNKLKFKVPEIKLNYEGELNEAGNEAVGTWKQSKREFKLTLQRKTELAGNENTWEHRPQRPKGPFPYSEAEVEFKNESADVTLAGTLTIPETHGPHPAVVLISGSGPQDRDHSLMGHKPFTVVADYLSRRGIAVLRYDDRGTAKSTGKFSEASSEDFADDVSAAVEFLKKHDSIDPEKIGLVGHSEGGLIAPIVANKRDDIAFVCLLAGTGVDGAEITLSQTEAMLKTAGIDEDEIKLVLNINAAVIDVAINSKPEDDITEAIDKKVDKILETLSEDIREEARKNIQQGIKVSMSRLTSRWMRFFLSHDPRTALRQIKCPVLFVIGSKDVQVVPEVNVPEVKKALTESGNKDFKIVELEGLNHLFQKCETGSMDEYLMIEETFNPEALKTIGDWIVDHTKK
jgi:uncharacterized protein